MPDNFQTAVQFVLDEEGPGSNLKNDKGGLTKWGIASHVYPQVANPNFSQQDAIAIYQKDYWGRCKCDEMPPGIALLVFNCAVNQGAQTAIKVLQRALGVKDDGILGSITLGALKKLNPVNVIDEFAARQLIHYFDNDQFDEFGLGWTRRSIRAHRTSVLLSASKGTTA